MENSKSHYDTEDYWQRIIRQCAACERYLDYRERDLVRNWQRKILRGEKPSEKVKSWLLDIYYRTGGRNARTTGNAGR